MKTGAVVVAAIVAACAPAVREAPQTARTEPASAAPQRDPDAAEALGRLRYLEEKVIEVARANITLQGRLDVLVRRMEALNAGAPDHSNTVTKLAARHDFLVGVINLQESVKAGWWCSSFACFRTESLCNAVEEHSMDPGETAEKCMARRRVFCRGFGKPFVGDRKGSKTAMTCHPFLSVCDKVASTDGGTPCLGVE